MATADPGRLDRSSRPIVTLLLGTLFMASAAGCSINDFVLFPERAVTATPGQSGLACEPIAVRNAAGHTITGWLILPPDGAAPRGTILISHGNAGNVGAFLPWAKVLAEAGYAAALYDYQGYGDSEGEADVNSLVPDARAVIDWLGDHGRLADGRLGLLGLSLGTLVSVRLAGEFDAVAAVYLEGALIPGDELKRKFGVLGAPVAWVLVRQIPDELDTGTQIARVKCPLLFVHSAHDEVTSLEGARELFDRAPGPKQWIEAPHCAHLTPIFDWPDYGATVAKFFDAHLGPR